MTGIIARATEERGGIDAAVVLRGGILHFAAAGATNRFDFTFAVLERAADPARRLR